MKRILSFLFLFAFIILLAGCNTKTSSDSGEYHDPMEAPLLLPKNPPGMTEGYISKEYFDALNVFYSRMTVYTASQYILTIDPQLDEDLLKSDKYFSDYSVLLDKAETIMSEFSIEPRTTAEKEISFAAEDYKTAAKNTVEMLRRFSQTRDLDTIRGNFDLIEEEAQKEEIFYEALKKYNLTSSK